MDTCLEQTVGKGLMGDKGCKGGEGEIDRRQEDSCHFLVCMQLVIPCNITQSERLTVGTCYEFRQTSYNSARGGLQSYINSKKLY